MCRLFGLHAGSVPVSATFWLLQAPDSLRAQSYHNPDGAGIGVFGGDGQPVVHRHPIAAYQDRQFASDAKKLHGTTFVAHVRYASSGAHTVENTHPFLQSGRLFAHNGVVQDLPALEEHLAELGTAPPVHGDTDSERVFALITAETARAGGDVTTGITEALSWIGRELPLYAVNIVLVTATELWAVRYPQTHELYLLDREAGGRGSRRHLHAISRRIRAESEALAHVPSVVIASEQLDDDPGWRLIEPGELLHIDAGLRISSSTPFPTPAKLLQLADLDAKTAQSQHPKA